VGTFVVLLIGCGMARVIDPAGLPVRRPLLVAAVADGWIVVDSAPSGLRAVVELTSRAWPEGVARSERERPVLRCAGGLAAAATRFQRELLVCREASGARQCGAGQPCANGTTDGLGCAQVVRAEFPLDRLPRAGDSLTLVDGDRTSGARWSRP